MCQTIINELFDNSYQSKIINRYVPDMERYYKLVDRDQIDEFLTRSANKEEDYKIIADLNKKRARLEEITTALSLFYLKLCYFTFTLEIINLEGE